MIIDWQITKASIGRDKDYFDKYSNSHKKVYIMCPICGQYRWAEFKNIDKKKTPVCRSCSLKMNTFIRY